MKRSVILVVVLLVSATAPARAIVAAGAYAHHVHLVTAGQNEGQPVEVNIFGGVGEVIVDTAGEGWSESGGCFEISIPTSDGGRVYDTACGAIEVEVVPVLASTTLTGTLDGQAFSYYNDPVNGPTFTDLGPTTVTVALTFTGTGDPRLAHSERTGIGVCGLPPDTRGVFAFAETPLERQATVTGTLSGAYAGDVDPSTLFAKMFDMHYAEAGACAEI